MCKRVQFPINSKITNLLMPQEVKSLHAVKRVASDVQVLLPSGVCHMKTADARNSYREWWPVNSGNARTPS